MVTYTNEQTIENMLKENKNLVLVFAKGENCGVCHAVEDRINNVMLKKFPDLDVYYLTIEQNPNFRGQHLVFTIPTLILFDGNKEIHRESRIIDFMRLERKLDIYFS